MAKASGGWQGQRGTRQERGYGREWEIARKAAIARDHGLCQPCLRRDRATPFDAVDHIKPKSQGGTDDAENLQCICNDCHAAKTAAEAAKAKGYASPPKTQYDAQGYPIW